MKRAGVSLIAAATPISSPRGNHRPNLESSRRVTSSSTSTISTKFTWPNEMCALTMGVTDTARTNAAMTSGRLGTRAGVNLATVHTNAAMHNPDHSR